MAKGYENWQQIPIRENGESLVSLRGVHPRIVVSPQYFLQKIRGASGDSFARETACQRLAAAAAPANPPDIRPPYRFLRRIVSSNMRSTREELLPFYGERRRDPLAVGGWLAATHVNAVAARQNNALSTGKHLA